MASVTLSDGTIFQVRPYQPADLAAVRDLHRRAFAALANGHTGEAVKAHIALIDSAGYGNDLAVSHLHLVVRSDDLPVASGGWMATEAGEARIRKVFVHPPFIRRGLASQLLALVEADARAHGFSRFIVRSNINAVPFYQHHGYVGEREGVMETPAGIDLPVLFMRKAG